MVPKRTSTYRYAGRGYAVALSCLCIGLMAPADSRAKDPVPGIAHQLAQLFDEICYSTLPDFEPIYERAKDGAWSPITGKALAVFAPEVKPDVLKAWSFAHGKATLKVSVSSSPVNQALADALPDFANSMAYACSLNLPGIVSQADLTNALQQLVGRTADETYDQDPFKVDFWSGITDDLAALLYHYKPRSKQPGGLISFVVLKK